MDQSLHGVSFPEAATSASDNNKLRHSYPSRKPKGVALPWMGFGVGNFKKAFEMHVDMIKRKRNNNAGNLGSPIQATIGEKFKLEYLRHAGHFRSVSRKERPVTFVKQYRPNAKILNEDKVQEALECASANKMSKPNRQHAKLLKLKVVQETLDDESAKISKLRTLPTCGVDCNKVRDEIFQKVNSLMNHKPEKVHIKARLRPDDPEMLDLLPQYLLEDQIENVDNPCSARTSRSSEQERKEPPTRRYPGQAATTGHQGVQTVFSEHKKVQTNANENKQVQWAILPTDPWSPKPLKASDGIADRDSMFKKVRDLRRQIYPNDSLVLYREVASATKETEESLAGWPDPGVPNSKKIRSNRHLLLYQEAVEMAKEQKDLERAREQRQDFWSAYERELRRGKVMSIQEIEAEKKCKRSWEEGKIEQVEEFTGEVKIKLNTFLDERLTLTTSSPVGSSPRTGAGGREEIQTKEDRETRLSGEVLVGLQGLRKIEAGESLQSLEAMEQQLKVETSHPAAQISPTELDCMKAAILSHNFYPRLVSSFIDQHKVNAPPDQIKRLERIRTQVIGNWRPDSPAKIPAHEGKIKKYQEVLTKFEKELEKPFQDALDFSWETEHYLDTIPSTRTRSIGGGSSGSDSNLKDFSNGDDYAQGY